jgi:putative SOS response-associated peptidase YedK
VISIDNGNVRDGKVPTSGSWKSSFEERRCFAPVSSYCEPDNDKPAKWIWFALKGDEERPLFAFSGIWRTWKGPIKKDGTTVEFDVYAFLTTEPNALTRSINHERMPVLLDGEDAFETWLRGSPRGAYSLVRSFDPNKMHIVQEGFEKRDVLAV